MLAIERILCPLDFSEFSARAYAYAYSLSQHYGATLLVEHVVESLAFSYPYWALPQPVQELDRVARAQAEEELRRFVKQHTKNGIEPVCSVRQGVVAESILSFAQGQSADLIVMGTHGRRGLERLALGSVTEKVLRKARCPVLVVRKPFHDFVNPGERPDPVHLRKILFCTDFSSHAEGSLQYALSLAMEYNAEMTLLHVLENAELTGLQRATTKARRQLEGAVPSGADNWCALKSLVGVGKPYQEIIQVALESQADLIVMGVGGRSAVDLALFGSTTHRVIRLGPCPVLAVHV